MYIFCIFLCVCALASVVSHEDRRTVALQNFGFALCGDHVKIPVRGSRVIAHGLVIGTRVEINGVDGERLGIDRRQKIPAVLRNGLGISPMSPRFILPKEGDAVVSSVNESNGGIKASASRVRGNVFVKILLLLEVIFAGVSESVMMLVIFLKMPETFLRVDVIGTLQVGCIQCKAVTAVSRGAFVWRR